MSEGEPWTTEAPTRCSANWSYTHHPVRSSLSRPTTGIGGSSARGAPEGTRTPDPRLRRPLLCPPGLLARSGRADLNGRPPAPKAGALPVLRYAPSPYRLTHGRAPLNSRSSCDPSADHRDAASAPAARDYRPGSERRAGKRMRIGPHQRVMIVEIPIGAAIKHSRELNRSPRGVVSPAH